MVQRHNTRETRTGRQRGRPRPDVVGPTGWGTTTLGGAKGQTPSRTTTDVVRGGVGGGGRGVVEKVHRKVWGINDTEEGRRDPRGVPTPILTDRGGIPWFLRSFEDCLLTRQKVESGTGSQHGIIAVSPGRSDSNGGFVGCRGSHGGPRRCPCRRALSSP